MVFWRRRQQRAMPDDGDRILANHLAEWGHLDDAERQVVRDHTVALLADKSWEAARGFTLTDTMCTVIAAQGALMALGIGLDGFREVRAIVVHPTTIVSRASRPGPVSGLLSDEPVDLHGEAHDRRGPLLLAWDAVKRDTLHRRTGFNVVIHELAHKLDMLDGLTDGTPPMDAEAHRRWVEVCSREYEALRKGVDDPILRDYAATDPGEFFAVAAEAFFDQPVELATLKPELYSVLSGYFRVDPAARRSAG